MPKRPSGGKSVVKTPQKNRKNPNGASTVEAKIYAHPDSTVLLSVAPTTVLQRADRERVG
jgi:hypothetical protein